MKAPTVIVSDELGLKAVAMACKEWLELDPLEVFNWRQDMKAASEISEWTGGWSQNKELLAMGNAPSFVVYRTKTLLIRAGWHPDAAQNWDRTQEGNKWGPSKLWKKASALLLPEMETSRKERRQLFHKGVDFRA